MEMLLKIYKNGEQVNEITNTDKMEIYQNIAKLYYQKQIFKYRTSFDYKSDNSFTVTQHTQQVLYNGDIIKYIYKYTFDGVRL